jgi:hypothetical protein
LVGLILMMNILSPLMHRFSQIFTDEELRNPSLSAVICASVAKAMSDTFFA